MPDEYEVVYLSAFEEDLEKYKIPDDKVSKFFNDLSRAPKQLKDAHPLTSIAKPLWSAHFNTAQGSLVVVYFICDENEEDCFSHVDNHSIFYLKNEEELEHDCSDNNIFIYRMGTHKIYKVLDRQ